MFNLTFSTRRRLRRIGIIGLVILLVAVLVWVCWVIWIGRYVVYSGDGAKIDLNLPIYLSGGQISRPPSAADSAEVG